MDEWRIFNALLSPIIDVSDVMDEWRIFNENYFNGCDILVTVIVTCSEVVKYALWRTSVAPHALLVCATPVPVVMAIVTCPVVISIVTCPVISSVLAPTRSPRRQAAMWRPAARNRTQQRLTWVWHHSTTPVTTLLSFTPVSYGIPSLHLSPHFSHLHLSRMASYHCTCHHTCLVWHPITAPVTTLLSFTPVSYGITSLHLSPHFSHHTCLVWQASHHYTCHHTSLITPVSYGNTSLHLSSHYTYPSIKSHIVNISTSPIYHLYHPTSHSHIFHLTSGRSDVSL